MMPPFTHSVPLLQLHWPRMYADVRDRSQLPPGHALPLQRTDTESPRREVTDDSPVV